MYLCSSGINAFAFLFHMETQVLQEDDCALSRVSTSSLNIWANTVFQEENISKYKLIIILNKNQKDV